MSTESGQLTTGKIFFPVIISLPTPHPQSSTAQFLSVPICLLWSIGWIWFVVRCLAWDHINCLGFCIISTYSIAALLLILIFTQGSSRVVRSWPR